MHFRLYLQNLLFISLWAGSKFLWGGIGEVILSPRGKANNKCCWERNEFDKHLPTCYGQVCPGPLSSGRCKPTLRNSFRKSDGTGVAWGSSAWDRPPNSIFKVTTAPPFFPVSQELCAFLTAHLVHPHFQNWSTAELWSDRWEPELLKILGVGKTLILYVLCEFFTTWTYSCIACVIKNK